MTDMKHRVTSLRQTKELLRKRDILISNTCVFNVAWEPEEKSVAHQLCKEETE